MALADSAKLPATPKADPLLSWDRLGFRLLVLALLSCLWLPQGRMLHQPWPDLIRGEFVAMLPWAFLAPAVMALGNRVRQAKFGPWAALGGHVAIILLIALPIWLAQRSVLALWMGFASGWGGFFHHFKPSTGNLIFAFQNIPLMYFLILLGSEAMRQAQARNEVERLKERLDRQLSEARLSLLQRQLHPHFLFNALQAISTLLHRDPRTADTLLVKLSTLLRALLDQASDQTLRLGTELELTRKYLDIEQVRFGDRLQVEWAVDPSLLDIPVPSLVVLPLVENALRHGLAPKVGPVRLRVSARSEAGRLLLEVQDDGLGAKPPLSLGVGLGNTRERLRALHGEAAELEAQPLPEGGFLATLRLPIPGVEP